MPSDALPELLNSIAEDIRSGNLDAAQDSFDEVEDIYKSIDSSERRKQRKATVGRDSTETPSEVRKRLNEFAQATNTADLSRASILTAVSIYLTDPSQTEADEIATNLEEQANKESTLVSLEEDVQDDLNSVSLAALLLVTDTEIPTDAQPKGSAFDVNVAVENVGDEPAENVELSQESDASVSPESVSLNTLESGESATETLTVAAENSGEYALTLRADGDPGQGNERTERFRIVDKATALDQASNAIEDVIERIEDREELEGGREKSAIAKLETAAERVDDAIRFIDREKEKQANNMIEAAIRAIGAFLNYLEGLGNTEDKGRGSGASDIPQSFLRTITTLAEGIINQLSLAKRASI